MFDVSQFWRDGVAMASNFYNSNGLQPNSDGLPKRYPHTDTDVSNFLSDDLDSHPP